MEEDHEKPSMMHHHNILSYDLVQDSKPASRRYPKYHVSLFHAILSAAKNDFADFVVYSDYSSS